MKNTSPQIDVSDLDASIPFYRDVLGFSVEHTMPDDNGKLIHAGLRHGAVGLMLSRCENVAAAADPERGANVTLYFEVDDAADLDPFFARVRDAGARMLQEPTDEFWGGRDWGVADPDGYRIFFHAPLAKTETTVDELVGAATD